MDDVCPGWMNGPAAEHISKTLRSAALRPPDGGSGAGSRSASNQLTSRSPSKQQEGQSIQKNLIAERTCRQLFMERTGVSEGGYLNLEELALLMKSLGMDGTQAKFLMKSADKNGDGRIELGEFVAWIFSGTTTAEGALSVAADLGALRPAPKAAPAPTVPPATARRASFERRVLSAEEKKGAEKVIRDLFSNWADVNMDGFLDVSELALLMEKLGMNENDARRLMKTADKNGDELMTVEEFMLWVFSGTANAEQALEAAIERSAAPPPPSPKAKAKSSPKAKASPKGKK